MSDLFHYHKWLRLIWTNLQQSVCQSWMIFQDSISKFYIITGKAQLVKRNLTKSVLQWVTRGQQAAYRRVTNSWSTVAGMVMFDVATPVRCQMHHYHLQYHQHTTTTIPNYKPWNFYNFKCCDLGPGLFAPPV